MLFFSKRRKKDFTSFAKTEKSGNDAMIEVTLAGKTDPHEIIFAYLIRRY